MTAFRYPAIRSADGLKFSTGNSHGDIIRNHPELANGTEGYAEIRSRDGLVPGLVFVATEPGNPEQPMLSF